MNDQNTPHADLIKRTRERMAQRRARHQEVMEEQLLEEISESSSAASGSVHDFLDRLNEGHADLGDEQED